jgi:methylmalonyl-CoA/ethylmalonyl-CoA epimerase
MQSKLNNWEIDHIGIAVKDLTKAASFYLSLPGHTLVEEEDNQEHQVKIKFISTGSNLIELMEPLSASSMLSKFLHKRGEGLHHICYKVESVEKELIKLKLSGAKLIDESPRLGSRSMQVAFVHPQTSNSGVLIEICSC